MGIPTAGAMGPVARARVAMVIGLAGVVVLALAVITGYASAPRFSMWRNFISELGDPRLPEAWRLNRGFLVGGALAAGGMAVLATLLAGALRWAALFAVMAAGCIALVGHFPLHRGMAHVVPAILAVTASLVASIIVTIIVHRSRLVGRGQVWVATILTGLQALAIVGGTACAVILIQRGQLDPKHLFFSRAVQLANPFNGGDSTINPIAISEWLFFVSSFLLLAGAFIAGPRVLTRR